MQGATYFVCTHTKGQQIIAYQQAQGLTPFDALSV
jgi:hypothetical protein